MGNPLLLEELLARHPKLRVQVMHAGYPMIDNMLTLLQANSHVYVDVAGLIWSYPIKEVNRYIERLVDGGFEDRVMFGTDQLIWPKLMSYSISVIQNADYLTPQQKRDILYNNAARFLEDGFRSGQINPRAKKKPSITDLKLAPLLNQPRRSNSRQSAVRYCAIRRVRQNRPFPHPGA